MTVTGPPRQITTADGRAAFRKTSPHAPPLFFAREVAGLRALAGAGARVPEVLDAPEDQITLAWIERGEHRTALTEERFGQELAALHRSTGSRYGSVDGEPTGYLGDCPVDLTPSDTWEEAWIERRLIPLARQAADAGAIDPGTAALVEQLSAEHLGPVEAPTLVHGDLWAGNRIIDRLGHEWLIDPCAQYGHREVDLAMMQLFGGFSGRALSAYAEAYPLSVGWTERIALYQSVPLLVHALLFGGGYGVQAGAALREAVR